MVEAPVNGPAAADGPVAVAVNPAAATVAVNPRVAMAEVRATGPVVAVNHKAVTVVAPAKPAVTEEDQVIGPAAVVNRKAAMVAVTAKPAVTEEGRAIGRAVAVNHLEVTNRQVAVAVSLAAAVTAEIPATGPVVKAVGVAQAAEVVLPAVTTNRVTTVATGQAATAAATNLHNDTTIQQVSAPARVTTNVVDAAALADVAMITIAVVAVKAKDKDGAAVMAATRVNGTSAVARIKANNAAGSIEPPTQ